MEKVIILDSDETFSYNEGKDSSIIQIHSIDQNVTDPRIDELEDIFGDNEQNTFTHQRKVFRKETDGKSIDIEHSNGDYKAYGNVYSDRPAVGKPAESNTSQIFGSHVNIIELTGEESIDVGSALEIVDDSSDNKSKMSRQNIAKLPFSSPIQSYDNVDILNLSDSQSEGLSFGETNELLTLKQNRLASTPQAKPYSKENIFSSIRRDSVLSPPLKSLDPHISQPELHTKKKDSSNVCISDSSPIITRVPDSLRSKYGDSSPKHQHLTCDIISSPFNSDKRKPIDDHSPLGVQTSNLGALFVSDGDDTDNIDHDNHSYEINTENRESDSCPKDALNALQKDCFFPDTAAFPLKRSLDRSGVVDYTDVFENKKRAKHSKITNIIADLHQIRNNFRNNNVAKCKGETSIQNTYKSSCISEDESDIVNSSSASVEITRKPVAVSSATTSLASTLKNLSKKELEFDENEHEKMLKKAKLSEPQKLKKVNQVKRTKDDILSKITCCFSTNLEPILEKLDPEYTNAFNGNINYEFISDEKLLPVIKFKRLVDCVPYSKKNIFVPIKEGYTFEDYAIILYHATDLMEVLENRSLKRCIGSIRSDNPDMKISVWVVGYDEYLKNLKSKVDANFRKKLQKRLDGQDETNSSSNSKGKKSRSDEEIKVTHNDIKEKILKYEIGLNFSFQSIKGVTDLVEWMVSNAYTLSLRHLDFIERNQAFANIGKVKSGDNPKDCLIHMLSQFKGISENRSAKFVNQENINSIGELWRQLSQSNDPLTLTKLLNNNHESVIRKVLLAKDENETI